MQSDGYRTVLMSAPSGEMGKEMARTVVEEGLAACGSVLPGVTSVYRWKDAIEEAEEALVVLKTTADRTDGLTKRLVELHPYEVPEVVALPVVGGHPDYLAWLTAETREVP